jgi:hypothetical protein
MKLQNAINKLNKAGFNVKSNDNYFFSAKKEGHRCLVEFFVQRDGEITCVGFRHEDDKSDSMSDYCATMFCDNITKAIKYVLALS